MEGSDIRIDKEGIWYYRGAHMFRKEILTLFFDHLQVDDQDRYYIHLNDETYYLDVEDTPFVVTAVYESATPKGEKQLDLLLSDDRLEPLDPASLLIGEDNILYCRVKNGKFPARFTRKGYYQLAHHIDSEDGDTFHISLSGQKYYIK